VVNREEPELEPEAQLVISATAPGGNFISVPWLWLHNNAEKVAPQLKLNFWGQKGQISSQEVDF
jgi:hypothetical protein